MLVGIFQIFLLQAFGSLKRRWKVCFLAWAATRGKIPTEDVLKRINFMALVGVLCAHLLIHFSVHRLFGTYLFPWWLLGRGNPLLSKMWCWLGEEWKIIGFLVFEIWSLWPFCGVLRRKGIGEFLRTKPCPIKNSTFYFFGTLVWLESCS